MNYPGPEYVDFAELAQRTGLTVDEAATRAVSLLIDQRVYESQPGGKVPQDAMIAASASRFPNFIEADVIALRQYEVGPAAGAWTDVHVAAYAPDMTYLSESRTGQYDRTGWTLRTNVLEAVRLANRLLTTREYVVAERGAGPAAAAAPDTGGVDL